jgi:hypothetical protein
MEFNEMFITAIISLITGISGLIWGQKKQRLDLQSQSYDNILKQIEVYEVIIDNLRQEVHALIGKVEEQQKIIKELEASVEVLCKEKR